jgi:very-short-patch-repair endonuclease
MDAPKKYPTSHMTARARQLRHDATIPERILWNLHRGGQLAGLKFRRQYPVGPYVTDFSCHEAGLVVEVDGMSHDRRAVEDHQRTGFLRRQGLRVLRVSNDDVLQNLEAVAMAILRAAGVEPT